MWSYGIDTYKIVYNYPPAKQDGWGQGVALVEARNQSEAMATFREQYNGEYSTVARCEKLFK